MPAIEGIKSRNTERDIRATEIMAAAGARELHDGEVIIVGLGLPEVATVLAKRTHAPRLSALIEVGVMNSAPKDTPVGLADSRTFYRATCWSGFLDVMGMNLHRGVVDTGFLGALELDRYGNINTTLLRSDSGKVRYVNGSAGGNDVASLAKRVIVIMRHEKRKLPLAVAHLTSPGFAGGHDRKDLHLRGSGPSRVITDKAVLGFDRDTHAVTLVSLHPGIQLEELVENTGFPLQIPKEILTTPLPTDEELRLLREEIDPAGVHLK